MKKYIETSKTEKRKRKDEVATSQKKTKVTETAALEGMGPPLFLLLRIILVLFTVSHASPPASPIQETLVTSQVTATFPSNAPNPPVKDSSDKSKSPVQDSGVSLEEIESFSVEHENLVLSVSDPSYTRRLTTFMNARKEKRLLARIGNALFLSAGMVFQQLEDV